MAAIGKIRSWGPVLVGAIALALFAFIAEEAVRSCESTRNDQRQQVGQVLGEKVSVQDFQTLVDEYQEVIKMQQGQDNLNEQQLNQVKDAVWQTLVQNRLIENEAKKLGLTVTDEEVQNILKDGTNQMLLGTPFVNQQTGRFDANALQKFIAEYKQQKGVNPQIAGQYETIYRYWTFIEKTLRQQVLQQKYQSLLAHCLISNPVEAKMSFADEHEESHIELAMFPYNSIEDSKVEVSDADMKAKYEKVKSYFTQMVESRDVKYVDVEVLPSPQDRAEIQKQFADYKQQLTEAADPSDVVRKSTSLVSYLGLPVASGAFPTDIAQRLDSMAVGSVYGPVENKDDNTLNLIKLVAKTQLPDSVEYRQIQVGGATTEEIQKRADSIYNALRAGADFEALAKVYGQTGEKIWLTTAQYQFAPTMAPDAKEYYSQLNTMAAGEIRNLGITQGNIIVQVLDRKNFITKYTAAVVKKTVDFSKDTYSAAYNKFSSFVSANQTADDIVKNAQKNGYQVQTRNDLMTSEHYLGNIRGTREALKWIFDAKEGEISPMYECGDNNHLLVVVLDKIHKAGDRPLDDPQVKEFVKAEVLKDKKAEQLMAKAEGIKSIADAKAKGATVDSISQITFAAPVFIASAGANEPALSGAVAGTAKGAFSKAPVKGNAGVYVFQVVDRHNHGEAFDAKAQEARLRQRAMQYASGFMGELYRKANVKDSRYLFF
ncbi:MAG: SurA N-terminal domain-containing protein [Prevotella sp.]|nr:SurA N-terminal domain-containing protein [Prevotella sp.]